MRVVRSQQNRFVLRRSVAVVAVMTFASILAAGSKYRAYEIPQGSLKGSRSSLSATLSPREGSFIDDAILVDGATALVVALGPSGGALELLDGVSGTLKHVREYPIKKVLLGDVRLFRFEMGAGNRVGVIFEYLFNRGTPIYEDSKTYLETFVFENGALVSASEPLVIGKHDSGPTIGAQPEYQYYAREEGPGLIEDARVLLRDVNADGFLDLILWQKRSECRPLDAPGGDDAYPFDLKSDTKSVLLYDPARKAFGAPKTMDGLPAIPPKMWDELDAPGNIPQQGHRPTPARSAPASSSYSFPEPSLKGARPPLGTSLDPRDNVLIDDAVLVDAASILFFVGREAGGDALEELDVASGTVRKIRQYPSEGPLPGEVRLLRFPLRKVGDEVGVIFEYIDNQGNDRFEDSTTYIEAFVFKSGTLVSATEPEAVARRSWGPNIGPNPTYAYMAVNRDGRGVDGDVRVLLRDVNADGYTDIVLWEKRLECIPIDEPGGRDGYPFKLTSDTKRVMLYDPKLNRFASPTSVDGLPPTGPELWEQLPSPNRVYDPEATGAP